LSLFVGGESVDEAVEVTFTFGGDNRLKQSRLLYFWSAYQGTSMTDPFRTYSHPGLALFGGILAGIMGTMNLIYGLLLLFNSEFLVLAEEGLFYVDATAWGWLLLVFGVVQVWASIGILTGKTWARLVGIAWASLVVIGNMFFLPAFPFWSLLIITLGILIIYALSSGLGQEDA